MNQSTPIMPIPPIPSNPLKKYFRQPKIYIKLPSSGNFYKAGSIELTETGEYPVFPMTAKDDLLMKTPDALLNGQATVDVIQSCMPNIKNAWDVPSIDLDAILVAIRLASQGEKLEVSLPIAEIGETRSFEVDLRTVLDQLVNAVYDPEVKIDDNFSILIRPLTYKEFTQSAIKTMEEQKIIRIVNDDSIEEMEKLKLFSESFTKLSNHTVDTVSLSIDKIVTPDGIVENREFINEFINNADKSFFDFIVTHLEEQKKKFTIKPFVAHTAPDDQKKGAPTTIEVPIMLDGSSFFD